MVIVGRSPERTAAVADELDAPHHLADFADLSQVRRLAAELADTYPRIEVLANNAGGIMGARELTVDGHERTFQVNHLAPFLLTTTLLPVLSASRATVIQTASIAAERFGLLDIDDLQLEHGYSPTRAYGNAKLANIVFTRELHRRHHADGISAVAFHPGVVATSFAKDTTHLMRFIYHTPLRRLFTISSARGAEPLTWLARGLPGETWQPGEYYERRAIATRVSPQQRDAALAEQLWDRSVELLERTR
ncbi:MAG: hypothetical protein JWM86_531 [Thermoleophilia bacterium]|nr:hypothetical protein [Thermoleophilia bacterium]